MERLTEIIKGNYHMMLQVIEIPQTNWWKDLKKTKCVLKRLKSNGNGLIIGVLKTNLLRKDKIKAKDKKKPKDFKLALMQEFVWALPIFHREASSCIRNRAIKITKRCAPKISGTVYVSLERNFVNSLTQKKRTS